MIPSMWKQLLHWAIFISVVVNLVSCIFFGVTFMPEPWP